jgi:hypothetical protein
MRRLTIAVIVTGASLLAGGVAAVWKSESLGHDRTSRQVPAVTRTLLPAAPLALRELLEPGSKLRPSTKARSLDGQRVRIAGFMAQLEEPIKGGFYLVPRPLSLDESGAGTGDLPLESVLVLVPGSTDTVIPHLPGALEGTGILEVGNRSDNEGRVSNFRLRLDPDQRLREATASR